jgi:hypothetical protein
MAEHYRFFNSAEDDLREYTAAEFAEYFSRFLSDGLYTVNGRAGLKVSPGTGLSVNIDTGYAFIRGYMYKNDSEMTRTLEPADTMLDRIDRIILSFDEVAREIKVVVKKGTFSSTPQAPAIEVSSTVKEMTLAQVRIRKSSAAISTQDITDERFLATCGLVSSLIDIPAQEMWDIWNDALDSIEAQWDAREGTIQGEWDLMKASWQDWFADKQLEAGAKVFLGVTEPTHIAIGDLWFRELGG